MISGVGTNPNDILLTYLQQPAATRATAALTGGTDPDGDGDVDAAGKIDRDKAQISGPGQLLGQLQQLQSQDPAKFQQVLTGIATQLTAASQQATGNESTFLSNLASKFQTAASTGDLSSLQPHHHDGHGVYDRQGQVTPTNSTAASGGVDLRQLFSSISGEVTQALGS